MNIGKPLRIYEAPAIPKEQPAPTRKIPLPEKVPART